MCLFPSTKALPLSKDLCDRIVQWHCGRLGRPLQGVNVWHVIGRSFHVFPFPGLLFRTLSFPSLSIPSMCQSAKVFSRRILRLQSCHVNSHHRNPIFAPLLVVET